MFLAMALAAMTLVSAEPVPDTSMITMFSTEHLMVFSIQSDGNVEFGPGFTTSDAASRAFIEQLGASVAAYCARHPIIGR